jgi:hypothetical protein
VTRFAPDPARNALLQRLREAHPIFRINRASATAHGPAVRLDFTFTAGDKVFRPTATVTGLRPDEAARVTEPGARRIVRAIAVVEAASYWKAVASPVIEIPVGDGAPGEAAWWESFWEPAMGEFYFRNGIDFTAPGFLAVTAAQGPPPSEPPAPAADAAPPGAARPLVMFSGGKDSLALAYALKDGSSPLDFFLYNPTGNQRQLAAALADGGQVTEVRREILPGLLQMNESGEYLNGHTPYSAWLALAAMLTGYLRGNGTVTAGNSRSDDEPNVTGYLGRPVNHQWTKSAEFEAALQRYAARWLPGAPLYCSPLRPLYELQIIRSLSGHMDQFYATQSCNKTKSQGWCGSCAKCAWVYVATTALFGRSTATAKTGADLLASPGLSPLYLAMCGLNGPKPFECTGTELEVRSAVNSAARQGGAPALAACLDNPLVQAAPDLAAVLKEWGDDHLMPAPLRERVRSGAGL